jgi:hypothetical protein
MGLQPGDVFINAFADRVRTDGHLASIATDQVGKPQSSRFLRLSEQRFPPESKMGPIYRGGRLWNIHVSATDPASLEEHLIAFRLAPAGFATIDAAAEECLVVSAT